MSGIELQPRIVVFGVGGAGGNAVDNMIKADLQGVEFVVANTDAQALQRSSCEDKIQLGTETTSGLGAGARPDVGSAAAEESIDEINLHLEGAHMVFIAAGMGGGTGTGSAPVIARCARERGILTVGVVTKPFAFEGKRRMALAEQGLEEIRRHVDTLIIIPNQNLFRIANEQTTFADAFQMADRVLYSGVRGITDLMVMPGLINLDFADVRTVMAEMGAAMMGTGEASGEKRALDAAQAAIANPLLDDISMRGAKGVLINITGGYDMTLYEVDEAANEIRDQVDPEANIILGSTFDDSLEGKMRVSVVATGIDETASVQPAQAATSAPQPRPQPQPQPEAPRPQARQEAEHRPTVAPVIEPRASQPEPVRPEPVARPANETSPAEQPGSVPAHLVFGAEKREEPQPQPRPAPPPPREEEKSGGLHKLFGWRQPSGNDVDAPFEDAGFEEEETRADDFGRNGKIIEDTDLEIPAFLRRSASH